MIFIIRTPGIAYPDGGDTCIVLRTRTEPEPELSFTPAPTPPYGRPETGREGTGGDGRRERRRYRRGSPDDWDDDKLISVIPCPSRVGFICIAYSAC